MRGATKLFDFVLGERCVCVYRVFGLGGWDVDLARRQ